MPYAIREFHGPRRAPEHFATVASIEAARIYLGERFKLLAFEPDLENDAADAMTTTLRQFAIEPVTQEVTA